MLDLKAIKDRLDALKAHVVLTSSMVSVIYLSAVTDIEALIKEVERLEIVNQLMRNTVARLSENELSRSN